MGIARRLRVYGILPTAQWEGLKPPVRLYAGWLRPSDKQWDDGFTGLTPRHPDLRNIAHDVTQPMQIPDCSVDVYQSEDVFEHIAFRQLPGVFAEIFRVLKPGGVFRLSVPDYRWQALLDRCILDERGEPDFDPGGGGRFVNGKVLDGGHVWFPVYESTKALFDVSPFAAHGTVNFLHYIARDGGMVTKPIDYSIGHIKRTPDYAPDEAQKRSIVVDAIKLPRSAVNHAL